MEEADTTITLIGTKLAKVGNEFIFRGAAKECETCKLSKTCLSLNPGGRYRIVNVRTGGKLECSVHDSGISAVEVIEEPIILNIESRKAIQGSKIIFDPPVCNLPNCSNYAVCFPPGLKRGDKFTVMNVTGDLCEPCAKGRPLKVIEVKR
jgi:uncharacterized protein (UPF0179 family)